jgi:hypothetical protein
VNPLDLAAKPTLKKVNRKTTANQKSFVPSSAEKNGMAIEIFVVGDVVFEDQRETLSTFAFNWKR